MPTQRDLHPCAPGFLGLAKLGLSLVILLCGQLSSVSSTAALVPDPKSGVVTCTDELRETHNPHLADDHEGALCFEGYLSKFTPWTNHADASDSGFWGIPHWTIHRVQARKAKDRAAQGQARPYAWFTVPNLHDGGLAPEDKDYHFSRHFREGNPDWYERGHLTQKYLAERMGGTTGWFTHNVVNAVPQRGQFNKGPWLALECYTGAWANENKAVWIITGPVFLRERPVAWLRSDSVRSPFPIAIPDALFKIVARKAGDGSWDALAFLYQQEDATYKKGPWNPSHWLVSIQRVEALTGETFATTLKPAGGRRDQPGRIWAVRRESFDPSCKRFAVEVP